MFQETAPDCRADPAGKGKMETSARNAEEAVSTTRAKDREPDLGHECNLGSMPRGGCERKDREMQGSHSCLHRAAEVKRDRRDRNLGAHRCGS